MIWEITASTSQVKMLVDELNAGNAEQARGIVEIGKRISQMNVATQSNAAELTMSFWEHGSGAISPTHALSKRTDG